MAKKNEFKFISPQDLHKKIMAGDPVIPIDTLLGDHYNKVHLPGARNACVFEVAFLENIGEIAPEKGHEMVLYGISDKTMDAATAAEKLLREGYEQVHVLEGGLLQWKHLGYELEGDDPDSLKEAEPVISLEDRTYKVDIDQSVIEWTGRNPNTKHVGTIALSKGEILVKEGQIGGAFEIDMASIKNINLEGDPLQPVLISHLMSDDFFFVKKFPKALFTVKSASPVSEPTLSSPNIEIKGVFEMLGVRKDLEFSATVTPDSEGGILAEAHFDFDRTRWKVIYGSSRFFQHLGMHLVFDHISLQLKIVAG